MAFRDPKLANTSSGGGGDDLPIGTFAYFPIAEVTPNWIPTGIYSETTYPLLAAVPGYTDVGAEIDTINIASSVSYTTPTSVGISCISNVNGTKMVFIIDDDTTHYIVDSSTVTGLTPIAGNYFSPALDINDNTYLRYVENIHDGTTWYYLGNSNNFTLSALDVDLQTNTLQIDSRDFNGDNANRVLPLATTASLGGNHFGFTPDNKLFVYSLNTTTGFLELYISNAGDYLNGTAINIESTVASNASNIVEGVGVSIDSSGNQVFWMASRNGSAGGTNSIWSYNKGGTGTVVNETANFDPLLGTNIAVSGNSACDTVMICESNTGTSGDFNFQKVTMGNMISTYRAISGDSVTLVAPIRGTNVGWIAVNAVGNTTATPDLVSFDNGDTWIQEPKAQGTSSSCFLKAWGVLGIGTNDSADDVVVNNDVTQFSSGSFLVPPLPPLMGVTHEARHKATQ